MVWSGAIESMSLFGNIKGTGALVDYVPISNRGTYNDLA